MEVLSELVNQLVIKIPKVVVEPMGELISVLRNPRLTPGFPWLPLCAFEFQDRVRIV